MRTSTILKPTDLRAPGALEQLFAHHRQQFGGWVMEDGGSGGGAGGDGGTGGDGGGSGGSGSGSGASGSGGQGAGGSNGGGDDLGFPPDTPVSEMTAEQRAAFDRHKRELNKAERARWRSVTGDRTPDQLQKELDELAELRKEKLTPTERQLQDARDQATTETRNAMRRETAATIYETALETLGVPENDIPDLVRGFNADGFITDDKGVDRAAITNFAKKFTPAGTADKRRRDFGAGDRSHTSTKFGDGGRAEAAKRFGKKSTGE